MKIIITLLLTLLGCTSKPPTPPPPPAPVSKPTEVMVAKGAWAKEPYKSWGLATYKVVSENFDALNRAQDMPEFCPGYKAMDIDTKKWAFVELISAMSYYESSWNPKSIYNEPPPLGYPSIGLLQLSYEDHRGYPYCPGKGSGELTDPVTNLTCGVKILAHQVLSKGAISVSSGAYWSVIKLGHKNNKSAGIKKRMSSFCRG